MTKTRTVPLFYKRKTADQKKEWRVCIQDPFENCEKIYPIQQKKVKQMINNIKEDSNVEKIDVYTVFEAARNNDRQALKVLKNSCIWIKYTGYMSHGK